MDSLTNDETQKSAGSSSSIQTIKNTEGSEKESCIAASELESAAGKSFDKESSLCPLVGTSKDDDSEWEDISTDDDSESEASNDELSNSPAAVSADNKSEPEENEQKNISASGSRKRKEINLKEVFGVEPKEFFDEMLAEKEKLMAIVSPSKKRALLQCYIDEMDLIMETVQYFTSETGKILKSAEKRYKRAYGRMPPK